MEIDVVIPTLTRVNDNLFSTLACADWVDSVFITKTKPLSLARKEALVNCRTSWVAMFDDDVVIPENWLSEINFLLDTNDPFYNSKIGAIATVAEQSNIHEKAYDRVVNMFFKLENIDTSPHINNVLVKRKLFDDYNPPALFFGEDLYFKEHVEKKGYKWIVLPYVGVKHLGKSKDFISLGKAYRKHYSKFQLLRRILARTFFIPYASLVNLDLNTLFILTKQNVQFLVGWVIERKSN